MAKLAIVGMVGMVGMILCLPTHAAAERKSEPVSIFILDTFDGADSHGKNVSDVTAKACLGRCEIRKVSLGLAVDRQRYLDALAEILAYAQAHPSVRIVVNMSFGSYRPDERERSFVQTMVGRGIILVAAAGNDDTDQPMYPAGYDGVIAVAAIDRDVKASYSNYGAHIDIGTEGFLRADIVKREDKVQGAYRQENLTWLIKGGTSFAAPRVSGFIGYVLSQRPDLSGDAMVRVIKQTAVPLREDYRFVLRRLGAGRISEFRVLYAVDPEFRRLVFVHLSGWIPFLVIWGILCIQAVRRRDLFGPAVEGVLAIVLIIVLQWMAISIWGEVRGRVVGLGVWAGVGVVALAVVVLRLRERAFVRNYILDEATLRPLGREDPFTGALHLRREDVVLFLIRERGIRPDLAERIVDRFLPQEPSWTHRNKPGERTIEGCVLPPGDPGSAGKE